MIPPGHQLCVIRKPNDLVAKTPQPAHIVVWSAANRIVQFVVPPVTEKEQNSYVTLVMCIYIPKIVFSQLHNKVLSCSNK